MNLEQLLEGDDATESTPVALFKELRALVAKFEAPLTVAARKTRTGTVIVFKPSNKSDANNILSNEDLIMLFSKQLKKVLAEKIHAGQKFVLFQLQLSDAQAAHWFKQFNKEDTLDELDAFTKDGRLPKIYVQRGADDLGEMTIDLTIGYKTPSAKRAKSFQTSFSFSAPTDTINAIVKIANRDGRYLQLHYPSVVFNELVKLLVSLGAPIDKVITDLDQQFPSASMHVIAYQSLKRARNVPGPRIGELMLKLANESTKA
jgi:hypothetical protein